MDGGYAEYVLVPSYKYLVKIRTAYGAVKNANLKPDDNVVIVGAGGLGLMAIQLAEVVTGARIIAMDLDDKNLGSNSCTKSHITSKEHCA
jgi:propanol-preferring alcohol dehydrogenase